MIIFRTNIIKQKHIILMIYGMILLIVSYMPALAQENPPKPIIVVSTAQNLSFGTIIQGGVYGTVTVYPQGAPTKSGSVFWLNNLNITPAKFRVESIPGTLITIEIVSAGPLACTGGSMQLNIDASHFQSPFITTGVETFVTIGGTLIVGSLLANPPGAYSGTITVRFIQQ